MTTETKAGARHSAADMEQFQAMHDSACKLGAKCTDPAMKSGARHSAADMQMIQDSHDMAAGNGAQCDPANYAAKSDEPEAYAVKFIGDGETTIKAYSMIFGDEQHPDLSKQRDFFTKSTDLMNVPLTRVAYHHGFDPATKAAPIVGKVDTTGTDDIGHWFTAQLDKAHKYYDAIKKLIQQGALKTSSDAIAHYVDREPRANNTHWVKRWPMPVVSLTPTPAEPRMWSVSELKSIGVDLTLPEVEAEAGNRATTANEQDAAAKTILEAKEKEMDEKQIQEAVAKALAEAKAQEAKDAELKAEMNKQIEAKAKELFDAKIAEAAKTNRGQIFSTGSKVEVKSKYDELPLDVATFLRVLRGKSASEELNRAVAAKSFKAIEEGKLEAKAMEDAEFKANEVMQSTLASYGDEWVTTQFSSQLWMKVRAKSRLMGFVPEQEIPKGYESNTIPLESTDFTFYNVSQTSAEDATMKTPVASITSSRIGTAQRVITVGKLGARGEVSGELDEDSIIDALPNALAQLQRQLPEEMDFVLFNADDTAATANINGNGSPTSGADYTIWKGLIVLGLVTNTANKTDASAALTSAKVRAFYRTLGTNGMYAAQDPSLCRVFCDYATWWTVMGLSDLLTVANAGEGATIRNGADADGGIPIHGIKWYPTSGVKLAQSTGTRHSATNAEDSSDILGRAVLVRSDQWQMRWKRRFKLETLRIPRSDITEVVATMRFGLGYFDTDASAVLYNINIS